jgi:hypothetical protein
MKLRYLRLTTDIGTRVVRFVGWTNSTNVIMSSEALVSVGLKDYVIHHSLKSSEPVLETITFIANAVVVIIAEP